MRLINADGRDVTDETLNLVNKVMGNDGISKAATITTGTGLNAYDLEAPAKNLYPVLTPLRNRIPRVTKSSEAGTAANWKEVTSIAGNSSLPAMPWVPEGQRAARMQVQVTDRSASYVTLGLETDVTMEAQSAGAGMEDARAMAGTRLLHPGIDQGDDLPGDARRGVEVHHGFPPCGSSHGRSSFKSANGSRTISAADTPRSGGVFARS